MAVDQKYVQELFKKAGVDDSLTQEFMKTLGNDAVQKALSEGFVATPQHHSTLDKIQNEARQAKDQVEKYNQWYQNDVMPAFAQYKQGLEALAKYQELYGPIENATEARAAAQATGMTKEQVEQILKQREAALGQAFTSLSKDIAWATADHAQRFKGEVLDHNAVEKHMLEKGMSFAQAYKDMIAPKLEEQRNSEWEAKVKAAREEGYRDAASKAGIPVDSRPKDPHPIFDQKTPAEGMSPLQQERHSEAAFLEGWNNFNNAQ